MNSLILVLFILILIMIFIGIFMILLYNRLVKLRQRVQNAWSQIDIQLRKRYDMIPNLVASVKALVKHEETTFEKVTLARTRAMEAGDMSSKIEAENQLTGALKSLFAVAENYPEIKSNTNFLQLQAQITDVEEKISYSRQFYNDTVQGYNTQIETFPYNLFAGLLGFSMVDYFNMQGDYQARENVNINF